MACLLLLESGGSLLQENSGGILIDGCDPTPQAVVPNIVGLTVAAGTARLNPAPLVIGSQTQQYHPTIAAGVILTQTPLAGTVVAAGSSVNVTVSLGPVPVTVPEIRGGTAAAANVAILSAGMRGGTITYVVDSEKPIGTVATQSIPAGTIVPAGTALDYVINVFIKPFDYRQTVISQYANSPTILGLIDNMAEYIDQRVNMQNFYAAVWNVDTAVGFGLDIWGKIVGVSRLLRIPGNTKTLGFFNSDIPPDWAPFNQGTFFTGAGAGQSFLLPDDTYRLLILTKALANIVATTVASINQLLRNLFPGRGVAYVIDNGGMSMTFYFEFDITAAEYAILTQSNVLPHPAGVQFNVIILPAGVFGFQEMGGTAEPFDQGVFYQPPI